VTQDRADIEAYAKVDKDSYLVYVDGQERLQRIETKNDFMTYIASF
jgi:hypothetical protein